MKPAGYARTEAARVARALEEHDRRDTDRFAELNVKLDTIGGDVKSLLASRSYVRGAWKAIVTISAGVAAAIGLAPALIGFLSTWLR